MCDKSREYRPTMIKANQIMVETNDWRDQEGIKYCNRMKSVDKKSMLDNSVFEGFSPERGWVPHNLYVLSHHLWLFLLFVGLGKRA